MKTLLFNFLLFANLLGFSQKIKFNYDAGGNQISRVVSLTRTAGEVYKTMETVENKDFIIEDKISYYPNPVLSQLYVNWQNRSNVVVRNIEIFNMGGQLLENYNDLKYTENVVINFETFTNEVYNVLINFENGAKQTLKIIKK